MDSDAEFTAEIARFERDLRAADKAVVDACRRAVEKAVKAGEKEAKTTHRYVDRSKDGLTKSIRGVVERTTELGAEGYIEATAPYAEAVNNGTRAHDIVPKRRKWLKFEVGGETVFARKVRHPGTKADGFMDRAEVKANQVLEREVRMGVEQALEILKG